jgi:hypothetical protein
MPRSLAPVEEVAERRGRTRRVLGHACRLAYAQPSWTRSSLEDRSGSRTAGCIRSRATVALPRSKLLAHAEDFVFPCGIVRGPWDTSTVDKAADTKRELRTGVPPSDSGRLGAFGGFLKSGVSGDTYTLRAGTAFLSARTACAARDTGRGRRH